MMRLSEYKGEEAIEKLADLLEPASEIMTDKELVEKVRKKDRIGAVKVGLKNHKKAVIQIMAILNDCDPETYQPSLFELPVMLLQLFNDPDVISLFTLQGQNEGLKLSGSAMENTEDDGK